VEAEDAVKPKYKRAIMILEMAVPEVWIPSGGRADLEGQVESLMGVRVGLGVGPGGAVLQALYVRVWEPGTQAGAEEVLDRYRRTYPLRPHEPVDDNAMCVRCHKLFAECKETDCRTANVTGWAGNPIEGTRPAGFCCVSGAENFPAPCPWHTQETG
jgi:hypothetical protein